ncbi:TRAP transporter small permease [Phaeobacter sp. HF9A]|uniref:TRAP transporter small permease n=1 Tax=Phaeobacter sp. HF9A TaxID=2721561 RepID=UPI0014313B75|nr:TRAP transporter small permease subunit [Phaeobacter sp. HF9A]NIZ11967.1 TRAP transporter small permease [Phaeobacter sp. HF9A]
MTALFKLIERFRQITVAFAAVVMAGLACLVFVDVTGRYVFSAPLPGTVELIEGFMAIVMFGALAEATRHREHIRLDFLLVKSRGRARQLLEMLSDLAVLLLVLGATWGVFERTLSLYESGDLTPILDLPLYMMAALALLTLLVACIVAVLVLVRGVGNGRQDGDYLP